jgi:hypothetical protein
MNVSASSNGKHFVYSLGLSHIRNRLGSICGFEMLLAPERIYKHGNAEVGRLAISHMAVWIEGDLFVIYTTATQYGVLPLYGTRIPNLLIQRLMHTNATSKTCSLSDRIELQ